MRVSVTSAATTEPPSLVSLSSNRAADATCRSSGDATSPGLAVVVVAWNVYSMTSAKAYPVWIWSPNVDVDVDLDDFQNSVGTYLVQRYFSDKIFRKIWSFFSGDMNQIVEKCSVSPCCKNSLKNPRFGPDADVFQNLIRLSFPRDTSVIMELDVSSTNNVHHFPQRPSSLFKRLGERQFTNCIMLWETFTKYVLLWELWVEWKHVSSKAGPKFADDLRTILRQFSDLLQSCDNWRIHRTFMAVWRPIF